MRPAVARELLNFCKRYSVMLKKPWYFQILQNVLHRHFIVTQCPISSANPTGLLWSKDARVFWNKNEGCSATFNSSLSVSRVWLRKSAKQIHFSFVRLSRFLLIFHKTFDELQLVGMKLDTLRLTFQSVFSQN